jgi:hypothetical protein
LVLSNQFWNVSVDKFTLAIDTDILCYLS